MSLAVYFMNKKVQSTLINIGTGIDYTIKQYAMFVIKSLGYKLKINFKKNTPITELQERFWILH